MKTLQLPALIGDVIYEVLDENSVKLMYGALGSEDLDDYIQEFKITEIHLFEEGEDYEDNYFVGKYFADEYANDEDSIYINNYNKTWFTSLEEAEKVIGKTLKKFKR